jgi:hypothetical protein
LYYVKKNVLWIKYGCRPVAILRCRCGALPGNGAFWAEVFPRFVSFVSFRKIHSAAALRAVKSAARFAWMPPILNKSSVILK